MKTNNVRVLERAIVPGAPVRPKPLQNLMHRPDAGARHRDRPGVRDRGARQHPEDPGGRRAVAGRAGAGTGADHRRGRRAPRRVQEGDHLRERDLGVFLDPKSVAAECCRSIRTNILFMSPDRPLRTMVVTSPSPQEGKTTTAINLGVTMAEAGGRVLIIDTDMRRPRLHRSFGVPNQTGISTVIVGKATIEEAIKRTDVPEPGRAAVRAGAAQSVGAAAHRALRGGPGRLREALRSDHPGLAADLGGDGSRRAREPRRRRRAGHQGGRDDARFGDARPPPAASARRRACSASSSTRSTSRTPPTATTTTTGTTTATVTRTATGRIRRPRADRSSPMATALVTGVTGQLGFYVAEQLAQRGETVWGLVRQSTLGRDQR